MGRRDVFSKLKKGKIEQLFVEVCEDGYLVSAEKLNIIPQMICWEEASVIVTGDLPTMRQMAFLLGSNSRKKEGDRNSVSSIT